MSPISLTVVISVIALVISIWTRIEAVVVGRRQRHHLTVTKSGEAFVAAQHLKNQLSECIGHLKELVTLAPFGTINLVHNANTNRLEQFETVYKSTWDFISTMEKVMAAFEEGRTAPLDPIMLEAKIARFNQWRALVDSDIKYLVTQALVPGAPQFESGPRE